MHLPHPTGTHSLERPIKSCAHKGGRVEKDASTLVNRTLDASLGNAASHASLSKAAFDALLSKAASDESLDKVASDASLNAPQGKCP